LPQAAALLLTLETASKIRKETLSLS